MNTSPKFSWLPIRKVALGALASGIVYLAHRLGVDLAPEAVEEALVPVVGFAVAYALKDPRVKAIEAELEESELAALIEGMVMDALAKYEK